MKKSFILNDDKETLAGVLLGDNFLQSPKGVHSCSLGWLHR
jgi:hypothetical protein